MPTVEFFDELYWYIQEKTKNYTIPDFENYVTTLSTGRFNKTHSWTREDSGVPQSPQQCTLQTFIRNKIHHPENSTMSSTNYTDRELSQSIQEMMNCITANSL